MRPEDMKKHNAANLIEYFQSQRFTTGDELSGFIIDQHRKVKVPFYFKVFSGICALLALPFFFLWMMSNCEYVFICKDSLTPFLGLGLIIFGILAGKEVDANADNSREQVLWTQLACTSMVVGKSVFVFSLTSYLFGRHFGDMLGPTSLIVTGITYQLFRFPIERFLSAFSTLCFFYLSFLDDSNIFKGALLFNSFFLLNAVVSAVLLTNAKVKRDYNPISYALILLLLLMLSNPFPPHDINPVFVNIIMTGELIALIIWSAGGIAKVKTEPVALACMGAFFLGLISAPGISMTISVMIIGYARYDNILSILGAAFLPIFLFQYYAALQVSPLHASGIMIIAGATLLASGFYLKYRGLDKGSVLCVQK